MSQIPFTIYLRTTQITFTQRHINYQFGFPTTSIITNPSALATNQINQIKKYIENKFEPFDVNVTLDVNEFNSAPIGKKGYIIFIKRNQAPGTPGPIRVIYERANAAHLLNTTDPLGALFLPRDPLKLGIVFEESGYTFREAAGLLAGFMFGLSTDTKNKKQYEGHGSGGSSWAPVMGTLGGKVYTQWSKGEYEGAVNRQDDIKIIGSKTPILKAKDEQGKPWTDRQLSKAVHPTNPRNIKVRTISKNEVIAANVNPDVPFEHIQGLIGWSGDVEYIKILLEAGTYTISVHKPIFNMLDARLDFLMPNTEISKSFLDNRLPFENAAPLVNNLRSSVSYCENNIKKSPDALFTQCVGMKGLGDQTHIGWGPSVFSNPDNFVPAIKFTLHQRGIVFISVRGDFKAPFSTGWSVYGSIGKYYLTGIPKEKVVFTTHWPQSYLGADNPPHEGSNPIWKNGFWLPVRDWGTYFPSGPTTLGVNFANGEVLKNFYVQDNEDAENLIADGSQISLHAVKYDLAANGECKKLKFLNYGLFYPPNTNFTNESERIILDVVVNGTLYKKEFICDTLNYNLPDRPKDVASTLPGQPPPGATPQPTPTATPQPTPTATPQPTSTATPQPTPTATPQPTSTATPQPTPTATPQPTPTATPLPPCNAAQICGALPGSPGGNSLWQPYDQPCPAGFINDMDSVEPCDGGSVHCKKCVRYDGP